MGPGVHGTWDQAYETVHRAIGMGGDKLMPLVAGLSELLIAEF
jgi:hypothetical protein